MENQSRSRMAYSVKGRLGRAAGIWELATVVQTNRRSSLSQTPFSLYYMLTSSRSVLDREEFTNHIRKCGRWDNNAAVIQDYSVYSFYK